MRLAVRLVPANSNILMTVQLAGKGKNISQYVLAKGSCGTWLAKVMVQQSVRMTPTEWLSDGSAVAQTALFLRNSSKNAV